MKINTHLFMMLAICLILSACSDSVPEDEATITIRLGSSGNARTLVGNTSANPEYENFDYELYIDGSKLSNLTVTKTASGANLSASISVGSHTFEVRAYGPNPYPSGTPLAASGDIVLRAIGEPVDASGNPVGAVNISAGTSISLAVSMLSATAVTAWDQVGQVAASEPSGTTRKEIIFFKGSSYTADSTVTINRPIILLADGSTTITRGSGFIAELLIVDSGGALTLGSTKGAALTISGGQITANNSFLIRIQNNGNLTMNNGVRLIDNYRGSSGLGSAVWVAAGTFTMNGGEISGNTTPNGGGGVFLYNASANFIMKGGSIKNNTTTDTTGGGVEVSIGTFTMQGGTISGNTAVTTGGGVFVDNSGTFIMEGGSITGNKVENTDSTSTSGGNGGGVGVKGVFIMQGGTISGNNTAAAGTASTSTDLGNGGGVYVGTGGSFTLSADGIISGNHADGGGNGNGGGVYVNTGATFSMTGGKIANNTAVGTTANDGGGGLYTKASVTLTGGEISGNQASHGGGGIAAYGSSVILTLKGSIRIIENRAAYQTYSSAGGGVYLESGASLVLEEDAWLNDNYAGTAGGGVYAYNSTSTITINGGKINGNSGNQAGGVYCPGAITMTGGEINGNTARTFYGGGVSCGGATGGGPFNMSGGTISGNQVTASSSGTNYGMGGGVYLVSGTFTMSGSASITGNSARNSATNDAKGGGVYVCASGTFNQNGCDVSGNFADVAGTEDIGP